MILEVVQSKWSLTWHNPLGPRMSVLELMKGRVLQTLREQLKVPGSRSVRPSNSHGKFLKPSHFSRYQHFCPRQQIGNQCPLQTHRFAQLLTVLVFPPISRQDSIPYSQFLRLRRLCSEDSDFNSKCDEISNFFSEHGYPDSILSKALNRVQNVNRESALEPSASDNEERIPFTITFHPNNLAARNVVLRSFKILQSDPETAPIFPNLPLVSFKRDRNLRNSLVRSSLPSNLEPGTFNCSRKVCNRCPFINFKTHIRGPNGLCQVNDHFDCTTSNIICCITCTLCNKLYIGESGRKLGDRFREHLLDVKNKGSDLSKPVARHFNLPGHSHEHMEICGIYLHLGNNETRKRKEQRLIFKLGALANNGINERFSFA